MAFLASLLNGCGSQEEPLLCLGRTLASPCHADLRLHSGTQPAPGQRRLWQSPLAKSPQKILGLSSVAVTINSSAPPVQSGHLFPLGRGDVLLLGQKWLRAEISLVSPERLLSFLPSGLTVLQRLRSAPGDRGDSCFLCRPSDGRTVEGKASGPAPVNYSFRTEARSLSVVFVNCLPL